MKRILPLLLILIFVTPTCAAVSSNANQDKPATPSELIQKMVQLKESEKETLNNAGDSAKNRIENRITNGEGSGIQEYLQTLTPEERQEKAENARQNMSAVAQKVRELLDNEDRFGGIGQEVSQFAREQNEAQIRLEKQYEKIQNRNKLLRFILGPDNKNLDTIKEEIQTNEDRLNDLVSLQEETETDEQKAEIKEMIETIRDQNIALLQTVNQEEASVGIFGYIRKLFNFLNK